MGPNTNSPAITPIRPESEKAPDATENPWMTAKMDDMMGQPKAVATSKPASPGVGICFKAGGSSLMTLMQKKPDEDSPGFLEFWLPDLDSNQGPAD
jgi:hypothetical protein